MDLGDIEWGNVDWIGLDQDRYQWRALVNAVMKLLGSTKCWEMLKRLHNA
jgi:hypothetical protein